MSILEMSLHGGVIIAAVLLLRRFALNRLPKKVFAALWELAMLRLVIPLSVSSKASAYNLLTLFSKQPEPIRQSETVLSDIPRIQMGNSAGYYHDILPAAAEQSREVPIWLIVYILGAALCLIFFAVSYIMLLRSFRFSLPCENQYVKETIDKFCLRRRVDIRICESISSPLTYGIFRPIILLPKSMAHSEQTDIYYVICHELVHIGRWDNLRKLLAAVVLSIHWFNPAVWLLYFFYNRDIELCCDEAVVQKSVFDCRYDYATALIVLAEKANGFSNLYSHFNGNSAEERISSIMKTKKTTIFSAVASAAIILTMAATLYTSAAEDIKLDSDNGIRDIHITDYDNVGTLINDAIIISNGDDGTAYYSTDGVNFQICPNDFFNNYTDIEWWSYEEYKEWLENEKVELLSLLGERAWTQSDGYFIWTQEKIDEAIAMYESELEKIKNGVMISKPQEDGTQYISSGTADIFTSVSEDYRVSTAPTFVSSKTILEMFGKYGITVDENGNLLYNGEMIRYFTDSVEVGDGGIATKFNYYRSDGIVDVRTVYKPLPNPDGSTDPFGELIGLEKADNLVIPQQCDIIDSVTECYKDADAIQPVPTYNNIDDTTMENTTNINIDFHQYERFGLIYDNQTDCYLYNGDIVRFFNDPYAGVSFTNFFTGVVDIETKRSADNRLIGIVKCSQEVYDMHTQKHLMINATTEAVSENGSPATVGTTFEEIFAKYSPYGISYRESNDGSLGNVYLNGKLVKRFTDFSPDGSVFSFDSNDGGDISVITIYDNSGKLCGIKKD